MAFKKNKSFSDDDYKEYVKDEFDEYDLNAQDFPADPDYEDEGEADLDDQEENECGEGEPLCGPSPEISPSAERFPEPPAAQSEFERWVGTLSNEDLFGEVKHNGALSQKQKDYIIDFVAEKNMALVYYTVNSRKALGGMMPLSELDSAALLAYAKAIKTFDPDKGFKFSTYCVNCMHNEISYAHRAEDKHYQHDISMEYPKGRSKDGEGLKLEDTLKDDSPTPDERVDAGAMRKAVLDSVMLLPPVERYVIVYRFGLDRNIVLTQKEIASATGMSQANVSKLEKSGLGKLHNLLYQYLG